MATDLPLQGRVHTPPVVFRYIAFLSYNTRDKKIAEWLHKRLETYRVPRELIGRPTHNGVIQRRIGRVFRDRDEFRSAEDIETFIASELANSENLIVLCTPNSARKESWVGREIELFRKECPNGQILSIIGDGDPPACFPAQLLSNDSEGRLRQPLAADLRVTGDGRHRALLKIIAPILGVTFDELWRRDRRRRRETLAWALSCAMIALFVLTFLYVSETRYQSRIDSATLSAAVRTAEEQLDTPNTASHFTWDAAARIAIVAAKHDFLHQGSADSEALLASAALNNSRTGVLDTGMPVVSAYFDSTGHTVIYEVEPPDALQSSSVCLWDTSLAVSGSCRSLSNRGSEIIAAKDFKHFVIGDDRGPLLEQVGTMDRAVQLSAPKPIDSLAFSAGSNFLAGVGQDGQFYLWDVRTGVRREALKIAPAFTNSVAFEPALQVIATAGGIVGMGIVLGGDPRMAETGINVWDAQSGRRLFKLKTSTSVKQLFFTSDHSRLLAITFNGTIYLWDTVKWSLLNTIDAYTGSAEFVAKSADGNRVAIGSYKSCCGSGRDIVAVVSPNASRGNSSIDLPLRATAIALSPDGNLLAVGFYNGLIHLYDVSPSQSGIRETGSQIATLKGHNKQINALSFDIRGVSLVSASADGSIMTWKVRGSGMPSKNIPMTDPLRDGENQFVATRRFGFGRTSDLVSIARFDGKAAIWRLRDHKMIEWFCCHTQETSSLHLSADGTLAATASLDGTVHIWDVGRVKLLGTIEAGSPVLDASFSPKEDQIAIVTKDGSVDVVDLSHYRLKFHQKLKDQALTAVYSDDGDWIVVGAADEKVHIFDSRSFEEIMTLIGHSREVGTVAISPDKSYVAASSGLMLENTTEDAVEIWSISSPRNLMRLPARRRVTALRFFDDGKRLIGATVVGEVLVWDTATGTQIGRFGASGWALEDAIIDQNGRVSAVDNESIFRQWAPEPALVLNGDDLVRYVCLHILTPQLRRVRTEDAQLAPLVGGYVGTDVCAN